MADSLIDIFDLCVERLAAGETVEDCLRDYPDSADELRSMLEMSLLVFQAQSDTDDEHRAQAQTRTRIEEALQTDFAPRKGKNTMFTLRRSIIWVGGTAAAIFAFAFGFTFATTPAQEYYPVAFETPLSDSDFILTATQFVWEVTQTAMAEQGVIMSATPVPTVTSTVTVTQTPLPTMTAIPTLGSLDSSIEKPATSGDIVVSTSVAGYIAMTATRPPAEDGDGLKDKDTDETDSAEPRALGEAGREEGRDLGGGDVYSDIVPLPTMALPSNPDVSGSLVVTPAIALNQQQLDPMKAGEIDDNAEWDTYTEFRRNYLASYGSQSIVDLDITGRRIIKVVDAEGKPILGARVEVYMDDVRISDTLTYATGLTLFFPNAQKSTQRRDSFQVVVTVDQYHADRMLNVNAVGDVFEIRMPVVVIREPNALTAAENAATAAYNATAAVKNATAAAGNAATAAYNATTAAKNEDAAFENATAMAENAATLPPTPTPVAR